MRISYFLKGMDMGIWRYFMFLYYSGLYAMEDLLYLNKITLVSIWFRMALTWIKLRYKEILSHWHTHQLSILIGMTILIPTCRFFDIISDVDYWYYPFTFIWVQHWLGTPLEQQYYHKFWQRKPSYANKPLYQNFTKMNTVQSQI